MNNGCGQTATAVYIANLPSRVGRVELGQLLERFGVAGHVLLASAPDMIRRHSGLAVVEMATAAQARAAIRGLEGKAYRGSTLRARPALARDVARLTSMCDRSPSITTSGRDPASTAGPS